MSRNSTKYERSSVVEGAYGFTRVDADRFASEWVTLF
jgi:hypothetical protein